MLSIKENKSKKLEAALEEKLRAELEGAEAEINEDELFVLADYDETAGEKTGYSNYSYWRSTIQVFLKNKVAVFLLCVLVALLHAEAWAEGRLTKRNYGFLAYLVESEGKPDGNCGLSDSGLCGGDGSHKNQLAFCHLLLVYEGQRHFCHVVAVLFDGFFRNTEALSYFGDFAHLHASCDFNIRLHLVML